MDRVLKLKSGLLNSLGGLKIILEKSVILENRDLVYEVIRVRILGSIKITSLIHEEESGEDQFCL